ncbi:MAG: TGS domain-containing protein, partial [Chloroflexi bacterium]|nr:TGS domain-containing protein [Chloroflexota bacterium]
LEEAVALLEEHRIVPAHRRDQHEETGRRLFYVPILVLATKCDDADGQELYEIFCALLEEEWPTLPISTKTGYNLERLKKEVFDRLGIIRIYSKPPGKPPDLTAPYVMKTGSTIEDLAGKVHKDFLANLKSARVWGSGAFDGQMVGRDHVLRDGDVVELRM